MRIVGVERDKPLILITTQIIKCKCLEGLEGKIVSTTMVTGEGTNLDHWYVVMIQYDWQTTVTLQVYSKLLLPNINTNTDTMVNGYIST